jgi:cell division initiation protein
MKISPTAIRQKAFETAFRGYDKKEVSLFLEEMSVIMEQINQENLELRSKLQQVESEAKRLKDVEDSLFRTLKTAEDTGASIITEANEAAELIINEANQFAEQSTDQANKYVERVTKEADQYFQKAQKQADEQARIITSAAEAKAKETIKEIRDSMQSLVRSYEGLLDQREALVKSLKRLSQDALNQIDLSDAHFFRIDGKAYQRAVDELSRSSHFSVANIGILATQAVPPANAEPEEQFEEDMSAAGLDEETLETVEALQHELEEQGEIPVDEPMEDLVEEESESVVDEILPEVEDEVEEDEVIEEQEEIEEEIPMREFPKHVTEDPKPEDLKKSSGSFFDQFD